MAGRAWTKSTRSRAVALAGTLVTYARRVCVLFISFVFRKSILISFLDIDDCASFPCDNNGTCFDRLDGYTCRCLLGFTGDDCETSERSFLPILGFNGCAFVL